MSERNDMSLTIAILYVVIPALFWAGVAVGIGGGLAYMWHLLRGMV